MEMQTDETPNTLILIDKLRRNAHLGKHKHFSAADRSKRNHTSYGIPAVVINVLLGSLLFANLSEEVPQIMKWMGAFLALTAAGLSGVQTFFNFHKAFEAHRRIGNQYLGIARRCELLIATYYDGLIELAQMAEEVNKINGDYIQINTEAEAFPTNNSDYQKAFTIEKAKEKEKRHVIYDRVTLPLDTVASVENTVSTAG